MNSLGYYIKHPREFIGGVFVKLNFLFKNDELYLKILFRCFMQKKLNLKDPKTFSEKLQWLKLYNRKPEYTTMVDKYAVKEYVANIIGEEYIIPTLGVWDTPNDIDWDSLPEKFVLKTTHGGGGSGVVICKDKSTFDKQKAIDTLWRSYKSDIYKSLREWPYKNVPKRIIAEKFMEFSSTKKQDGDLPDYKFYCFDGEPVYCQVIRDRRTKETIDFYDMEWNHMPFVGLNPVAQNGLNSVEKPICLENMIKVCKELAKNIPFLRIDLYVIGDKEYFGEITFYPASGLGEFTPQEWNGKLGDLVNLQGVLGGGTTI